LRNVLSEHRDLEKNVQISSSSEINSNKALLLHRFQTVYILSGAKATWSKKQYINIECRVVSTSLCIHITLSL
jgi:hypothetical protein